jgi:nuclear pore complex protein Nup133
MMGCSTLAGGEQQVLRDRQDLEARFTQLRPEVLDTLREYTRVQPSSLLAHIHSGRNTHGNRAFKLAEDYRDFSSLASLCNKDRVYPPAANPNVARLNGYVEKYQYQFAKELYGWYIEHGKDCQSINSEIRLHGSQARFELCLRTK